MYSLSYVKAKSVKEAAEFLARNPEAKLLAGGMTMIPTLKARLARLVDAEAVQDAGLGEGFEGGNVGGGGASGVDQEVAVLVRELGAADAVAA